VSKKQEGKRKWKRKWNKQDTKEEGHHVGAVQSGIKADLVYKHEIRLNYQNLVLSRSKLSHQN
jgi:hypothetical protein